MKDHQTLHLEIPAHLAASLQAAVDCGEYYSKQEAAFAALSQWEIRRKVRIEELRALIQEGIDSGDAESSSMEDLLAEARKRFMQCGSL